MRTSQRGAPLPALWWLGLLVGGALSGTPRHAAAQLPAAPPPAPHPVVAGGASGAVTVTPVAAEPRSAAQRALDRLLPIQPARTVRFETTEVLEEYVDLSPDGRTFVFSVLGDLYTLPAAGGRATQLTRGLAWDRDPAWSPDGREIAYVSDATGGNRIWVMAADGTGRRPVAREWPVGPAYDRRPCRLMVCPGSLDFEPIRWLPSGQAIRSGDSLFQVTDGVTNGSVAPIDTATPAGRLAGAPVSPDGRYAYLERDGELLRYELATGATLPLARWPAGASDRRASSDGRWLLYVQDSTPGAAPQDRALESVLELRVRRVETGEDRLLLRVRKMKEWRMDALRYFKLRYFVTPDSRAVLLLHEGEVHRLELATGAHQRAPFTVPVAADVAAPVRPTTRRVTNDSLFSVRFLRWPAVSPDRRTLAFVALERLYTMALPGGRPRRLVAHEEVAQLQPAYSPDGRWVAYVTWSDTAGGHLWRVPAAGGRPERLTAEPARYWWPTWSPDGTQLAVLKLGPKDLRVVAEGQGGVLQLVPSSGGTPRPVATNVVNMAPATFTPDGRRLLFREAGLTNDVLVSVDLDGGDRRVIARMVDPVGLFPKGALYELFPSPDGRYVAYFDMLDLYLAPLTAPLSGDTVGPVPLGHSLGRGPIVRLIPGIDPRWDSDGKMLTWVSGPAVYRVDPARALAEVYGPVARRAVAGAVPPWAWPHEKIRVALAVPRRLTRGTLALRGARVITMRGDEVLERGTVVITNDRITAVGPADSVAIPRGATVLELGGKTIVPGLIDMHAHLGGEQELITDLAYGVTTVRNVGGPVSSLGWGERVETGALLGSRHLGVGQQLGTYRARLESLEDVRLYAQHFKRLGAALLKIRHHATRRGRQWGVLAAAEVGLPITGHDDEYGKVVDGYTGLEHGPSLGPLGSLPPLDAATQLWHTPTWPEGAAMYFDGWRWAEDPRYQRFATPQRVEAVRTIPRKNGRSEFDFLTQARLAAELVRRGGRVTPGSHGNYQGIGMHWVLWGMVAGGPTPHEALRAVTLLPAEGIGVEQDLGSLEVGKLADLLVLDKNPLEDIRHTLAIRYVMKNGELYDGETMAVTWPARRRPAPR